MLKEKLILLLLTVILSPDNSWGQLGFELSGGAKQHGQARITSTLTGSSSILGNQAGMTEVTKFSAEIAASRRYNIKGLDLFELGLTYTTNSGSFGICLLQYGLDEYKETKVGLAYAKSLDTKTSIGIQLDALGLTVPEFGSKIFYTAEIGFYSKLTSNIHLGAHLFSPVAIDLDGENIIPTRLRLGPKFIISERLNALVEFEKIIDSDPSFKAAVMYRFENNISFALGVKPTHSEISFGFTYQFHSDISMSGAFQYDDILGTTPSVGMSYIKQ